MESKEINFKLDILRELISQFKNSDNTKISKESLLLINEYLKIFTKEAILRSLQIAQNQQKEIGISNSSDQPVNVDIDHLEKILPQLLLDF
ncbi:centromere protein X-like protein [Conidiobolus coronatus NRRL 28638]|uniref:Centromere protein X-like protein n=1 Tax=Conidiobolus coronatus (strain ATCC 28846 / CBS 209.66 / NRRL 28638) TaxID=796925 RepID=A0A137NU00_CONC2|nr:centromere protein X-like protein [Conidiobolus coronatus NRRL 28638]|eukprot:KXN66206.1 centromere protein X-like protein [Conidiobolus coronatus NRRL 28638]